MPAKSVTIGPHAFSSQTAAIKASRNRLLKPRILKGEDHDFFMHVMQKHYRWGDQTARIKQLRAGTNAQGHACLYMILDDDREVAPSYQDAIKGKVPTEATDLRRAMREAIQPEIEAFRASHEGEPCALCGAANPEHVDHRIGFQHIAKAFLRFAKEPPTQFDKTGVGARFLARDAAYSSAFQQFHQSHIVDNLRMACRECNLRRTTMEEETGE